MGIPNKHPPPPLYGVRKAIGQRWALFTEILSLRRKQYLRIGCNL